MVQDILSDMNSDEVNSISDTIESMQVARIIKSCYDERIGNKNWPHLKQLILLSASGDTAKPTYMRMPANIKELHYINYDKKKVGETKHRYEEVRYVTTDEFLRRSNLLNSDNANITTVVDDSGSTLLIKNDVAPSVYTSFDDDWLVFDSFDSAVDSTLQASKTQCMATLSPTFTLSDGFVPDLPDEAFAGFLAEAKSTCFARLKQTPDGKAEQQATRQMSWLSRKSFQAGGGMKFPNYGRN